MSCTIRSALWLVVIALAIADVARASDSEFTRPTIAALPGVRVLVESFGRAQEDAGFDRQQFQTDVEVKLRLTGIKVLTKEEAFEAKGSPCLYVTISPLHRQLGSVDAYSIRVEVLQNVTLDRIPQISGQRASTWSTGSVGRGNLSDIREAVRDHTDRFINAWLAVNSRE
jgi:hypothetical protein